MLVQQIIHHLFETPHTHTSTISSTFAGGTWPPPLLHSPTSQVICTVRSHSYHQGIKPHIDASLTPTSMDSQLGLPDRFRSSFRQENLRFLAIPSHSWLSPTSHFLYILSYTFLAQTLHISSYTHRSRALSIEQADYTCLSSITK